MDSIEKSPLVTSIITTHNRKDLVLKAIASVQNQTYWNIEIVVVDDHSTDGTKEIIEEYIKDTNIRYIYNTDDLGGNHIRNIGIMEAKGDFVAFLDDDDEWLPEKIEKQVQYSKNNPNVGIICCGTIDVNGDKVKPHKISSLVEGDLSQTIFTRIPYVTSTFFIKTALVKHVGMFDENIRYMQDYELLIRLCQVSELGVCRENLIIQRGNLNNSQRVSKQGYWYVENVQYIETKHKELLDKLPPDIKKKWEIMKARDGVRRAYNTDNKQLLYKYLKDLFILRPQSAIKVFIKRSVLGIRD